MKRIVLIVMFLAVFQYSFSDSFSNLRFIDLTSYSNFSAADNAFGLYSGTANIWNISPLSVHSNPAKLGYHRGLNFELSNITYEKLVHHIYMDIQSLYMTMGWNGIGILIPMPMTEEKIGSYQWSPMPYYYDDWYVQTYAIGLNVLEFLYNMKIYNKQGDLNDYFDISLGLDFTKFRESYNTPDMTTTENSGSFLSYGLIARYSPLNVYNLESGSLFIDITSGLYFINPAQTKYKTGYGSSHQFLAITHGIKTAFAAKLFTPLSSNKNLQLPRFIRSMSENMYSVMISYDPLYQKIDDDIYRGYCSGLELCLLDILSFRLGKTDEYEKIIFGYGLNLNFAKTVRLQFNYTVLPENEFQKSMKNCDFILNIDIINLFRLSH